MMIMMMTIIVFLITDVDRDDKNIICRDDDIDVDD